jgi:hypothetical protein
MLNEFRVRAARATGPCRSLTRLLLAAFLVFAATSAGATPLYFTGLGGFGTDAGSASAATPPLELLDLDNPAPGRLLGPAEVYSAAGLGVVSALDCSDPLSDPSTCIALRVAVPPATFSMSAPPFAVTSTWTVTNSTGQDLAQAFLVFSSTEGGLSDDPKLVGLEPVVADDYLLITTDPGGGSYYFAAVELGRLAAGASVSAKVHYRVKDLLDPISGSDDFYLPKLLTEAIVVVPEPGTFLLVAAGLAVFVAIRRE